MDAYIHALAMIDDRQIFRIAKRLYDTGSLNGRIFIAGNGGSHAVAQHFASDLMKPVGVECPEELSVINLSDNMAFLTAVGNDIGFEDVFVKAAQTHGIYAEDTVVFFSVSGTSPNIVKLIEMCYEKERTMIGISGKKFALGGVKKWSTGQWEWLRVAPDIKYGTPLFYSVCESAFSAIAHEIARQFHILRGNYIEQG